MGPAAPVLPGATTTESQPFSSSAPVRTTASSGVRHSGSNFPPSLATPTVIGCFVSLRTAIWYVPPVGAADEEEQGGEQ